MYYSLHFLKDKDGWIRMDLMTEKIDFKFMEMIHFISNEIYLERINKRKLY